MELWKFRRVVFLLRKLQRKRETKTKGRFHTDKATIQVTLLSRSWGHRVVRRSRELKIETFSGRRQLQPDVTSSFVGYCACSCSPPCRRGPVGDVKLVCLALWRKRECLTFISIRFVAFSNHNFADYRS